MKVTGPESGVPAQEPAKTVESPADKAGAAGKAGDSGFAEKLGPAGAPDAASRVAGPDAVALRAIAADLQAGRITAGAAVDRVVGHVLGQPLVAGAPAPVRAKVEAALRDALVEDPLLAAKVRALAVAK